eukprot:Tbor_TRINITY_DN5730_c2_g1::TRINITY_DN5730_c2_g1_i1::g.19911::m.19911
MGEGEMLIGILELSFAEKEEELRISEINKKDKIHDHGILGLSNVKQAKTDTISQESAMAALDSVVLSEQIKEAYISDMKTHMKFLLRSIYNKIGLAGNEEVAITFPETIDRSQAPVDSVPRRTVSKPKNVIITSFEGIIQRLVIELQTITGNLKLFVQDPIAENEIPLHFSSWEQRFLQRVFQAKEKVQAVHNNIAEVVNICSVNFCTLSENPTRWASFIGIIQDAFVSVLSFNISHALWMYSGALCGKGVRELFSVNMKLSPKCNPILVPTMSDLSDKLYALMNEKIFSICPSNYLGEIISIPVGCNNGRYAKLCRDCGTISSHLQNIKQGLIQCTEHVKQITGDINTTFGELWESSMTTRSSQYIQDAIVSFEVKHYPRTLVNHGAFLLNTSSLQDTTISMLCAQLENVKQNELKRQVYYECDLPMIDSLESLFTINLPKEEYQNKHAPSVCMLEVIENPLMFAKNIISKQKNDNKKLQELREEDEKNSNDLTSKVIQETVLLASSGHVPSIPVSRQSKILSIRRNKLTPVCSPHTDNVASFDTRPDVSDDPNIKNNFPEPNPQSTQISSMDTQNVSPRPQLEKEQYVNEPQKPINTSLKSETSKRESSISKISQMETPRHNPIRKKTQNVLFDSPTRLNISNESNNQVDHNIPEVRDDNQTQISYSSNTNKLFDNNKHHNDNIITSRNSTPPQKSLWKIPYLNKIKDSPPLREISNERAALDGDRIGNHSTRSVPSNSMYTLPRRASKSTAPETQKEDTPTNKILRGYMSSQTENNNNRPSTSGSFFRPSITPENIGSIHLHKMYENKAMVLARQMKGQNSNDEQHKEPNSSRTLHDELLEQRKVIAMQLEERRSNGMSSGRINNHTFLEERLGAGLRRINENQKHEHDKIIQQSKEYKNINNKNINNVVSVMCDKPTVNSQNSFPLSHITSLRPKLHLPSIRPLTPSAVNSEDTTSTSSRDTAAVRQASATTPTRLTDILKLKTAMGGQTIRRVSPCETRGESLLEAYKSYCSYYCIKPNSGLLKILPSAPGVYVGNINLDLNYIGVKGFLPLLQILKKNRGLQVLNLKDNNLENKEIMALVDVLLSKNGISYLRHIDLSNNPVSHAGGLAILELLNRQKSLTSVVLKDTLIQPKLIRKINDAAEANYRR